MNEKNTSVATYTSLLRTKINDYLKDQLKVVGNTDIVPSYGALLYIVYINDGRVQIKTIYDTLLKQKTTITEMINRLVKLGYLTKESCCEDKRVSYVVATQKAMDFKADFQNISKNLISQVFNDFTEKEKDEFVRLLLKAINNFA